MVSLGNFLFHYRNFLFPVVYLLVLVPSPPLLADPRWAFLLGILTALLGQTIRAATIGLAYIKRGGRDRRICADDLVTEGLFRHSRNPLYLGNILILLGVAVSLNSLWFLVFGWGFFLLAYHAITRAEEAFLSVTFGEPYRDYCRKTPRFLMRLSGLPATLRSMQFNWGRLLVKEYGTTFVWTSGLILGLFCKHHLYHESSFIWRLTDTLLAAGLIVLILLYGLARYLKKYRVVQAKS